LALIGLDSGNSSLEIEVSVRCSAEPATAADAKSVKKGERVTIGVTNKALTSNYVIILDLAPVAPVQSLYPLAKTGGCPRSRENSRNRGNRDAPCWPQFRHRPYQSNRLRPTLPSSCSRGSCRSGHRGDLLDAVVIGRRLSARKLTSHSGCG
jgi:hypothetical protein